MNTPIRLILLTFVAMMAATGCRSLSVRGAEPGNLSLVRAQPAQEIYFETFALDGVQLSGDHGDAQTAEANKDKWFSHVLVGAQETAKDKLPGAQVFLLGPRPAQLAEVEEKYEARVKTVDQLPANALRVTGRFVYSDEISGGARALVGIMAGKSWTRARVQILRGDEAIYTCHIDGKYLGSGYSWGYETLGANEEVGRAIIEVIAALKAGKPIKSEALTPPGK